MVASISSFYDYFANHSRTPYTMREMAYAFGFGILTFMLIIDWIGAVREHQNRLFERQQFQHQIEQMQQQLNLREYATQLHEWQQRQQQRERPQTPQTTPGEQSQVNFSKACIFCDFFIFLCTANGYDFWNLGSCEKMYILLVCD